jgi:hypothetical protein
LPICPILPGHLLRRGNAVGRSQADWTAAALIAMAFGVAVCRAAELAKAAIDNESKELILAHPTGLGFPKRGLERTLKESPACGLGWVWSHQSGAG